jgi:hypothetical protein
MRLYFWGTREQRNLARGCLRKQKLYRNGADTKWNSAEIRRPCSLADGPPNAAQREASFGINDTYC